MPTLQETGEQEDSLTAGETRKGHAGSRVLGLVALAGLLPAELLLLTLSFDGAALANAEGWPAQGLIRARLLPQLLTAGVGALLAVYASRLPSFERRLVAAFHAHPRRWFYVLGHLAAFGALFALSRIVFGDARADPPWAISWAVAVALTLMFWLGAIAAPRFWTAQLASGRVVLSVGAAVAASAVLAGRFTERYWETFATATFEFSRYLLGLFYDEVTATAATRTIRVEGFGVQIAPDCSGLEGIGLVTVFLAAYLWFFRDRHRFPHSLLLFPIGAVIIWIVNAFRISGLVVVGAEFSPAIAVQGFHSQAGWIGFTVVSLGIVALAGRIPFFLKAAPPSAVGPKASDTPPYLLPVMALLAAGGTLPGNESHPGRELAP
ncbi:MAG: archaeosortase/exosortase family protein, partial [Acidobacteria bacterium]|nr:archaeosortase/exosortase family protein [Acidobacteriota bacterium]